MSLLVIVAIVWLGSGFLSAGFWYATLQRTWPILADRDRDTDAFVAWFGVLFGPFGLLSTMMMRAWRFGWLLPGTVPPEMRK